MQNNCPTKVIFEDNYNLEFFDELKLLGKKSLIVTGKNSAIKSGALCNSFFDFLKKYNIDYYIFNEIFENPDFDICLKGKELFLANNCDFVIAIGGGSAIDAGKLISILAYNNFNENTQFNLLSTAKAYPIVAIPTTSGTGSEVTPFTVLTMTEENGDKIKKGIKNINIYPSLSFLNYTFTYSLNEQVTRDTAIDALSHLLEGLYSKYFNEYFQPMTYESIQLIYQNLDKCLSNPNNPEYRKYLMHAAYVGGLVISESGTTLQHSIGYPLTTEFGCSHGLANGLVMKQIYYLYKPFIENRFENLLNYLKINIDDFFKWLDSFNMKFDGKIDDSFLNKRVPEVMNSRNMDNNPSIFTENDIINIYKSLK
jgi:alcohol dehydrogenase